VVREDGDKFSIQTITGPQSWTDEFEIGKPAMITGPGKRQMPVNFKVAYSGILKSKVELESKLSKFCQLIASLSVVLPQLNLTKLKLEYQKLGF